jgi:hypothetical protein
MNAATSSNISSQHTQIYGNQMSSPNTNLALLIDGDIVSAKVIAGLMTEIANYGTASVRRIYDDWTSSAARIPETMLPATFYYTHPAIRVHDWQKRDRRRYGH